MLEREQRSLGLASRFKRLACDGIDVKTSSNEWHGASQFSNEWIAACDRLRASSRASGEHDVTWRGDLVRASKNYCVCELILLQEPGVACSCKISSARERVKLTSAAGSAISR